MLSSLHLPCLTKFMALSAVFVFLVLFVAIPSVGLRLNNSSGKIQGLGAGLRQLFLAEVSQQSRELAGHK